MGVAEQSGDLSIVEDSRGNIQVEPTQLRDPVVSSVPTAGRRQVRGLTTPVGGTEEEEAQMVFAQMAWHKKNNDEEAGKWLVSIIIVIQTGNFCGITWKFHFRILKMIDFYSTFGYFWNFLDEMPESAAVARNTFLSVVVPGAWAPRKQALHIFFQGDTNRHVAEHALNKGHETWFLTPGSMMNISLDPGSETIEAA